MDEVNFEDVHKEISENERRTLHANSSFVWKNFRTCIQTDIPAVSSSKLRYSRLVDVFDDITRSLMTSYHQHCSSQSVAETNDWQCHDIIEIIADVTCRLSNQCAFCKFY